jgi:hypothetical protein
MPLPFAHLTISTHLKEDKAKLDVMFAPTEAKELALKAAHIIQGMTGRSRTGIIFEMVDESGKKYFAKTTAQLIVNGVAAAARGFAVRCGDNPDIP